MKHLKSTSSIKQQNTARCWQLSIISNVHVSLQQDNKGLRNTNCTKRKRSSYHIMHTQARKGASTPYMIFHSARYKHHVLLCNNSLNLLHLSSSYNMISDRKLYFWEKDRRSYYKNKVTSRPGKI